MNEQEREQENSHFDSFALSSIHSKWTYNHSLASKFYKFMWIKYFLGSIETFVNGSDHTNNRFYSEKEKE